MTKKLHNDDANRCKESTSPGRINGSYSVIVFAHYFNVIFISVNSDTCANSGENENVEREKFLLKYCGCARA